MSNRPKAVAYARCSTLLSQDPENQLVQIREFAQSRSFELVDEFVDHGISGAQESRPELDRLVKAARQGRFKVLIVAGIDRIGRSTKHLLNLIDELKHYGVRLISLRENLDFTTPTGEMALTVLAGVSTLERKLTSERIKQALAAKKLAAERTGNGWKCGRPSKLTTELEIQIIEMRSNGLSIRQIARRLSLGKTTIQRVVQKHEGKSNS